MLPVVVVLFVGVLLAGCTGPPAGAGGERTPSPTPTASPAPTLPEKPRSASRKSEQAVQSFALYYHAVWSYGYATGDWEELKDLSLSTCKQCNALWTRPIKPYLAGKVVGNDPSIQVEGDSAAVDIDRESDHKATWARSPGAAPTPCRSRGWVDDYDLRFVDGSWRVAEILLLPVDECSGPFT